MIWRVGMKAVCIEDGSVFNKYGIFKDGIYVVRDVNISPAGNLGLLFEKIQNADFFSDGREKGFVARYFRPLVEKKTSIEIFERIADGKLRVADPQADERIADAALTDAGYMPEAHYVEKWGGR